jgi:hypothetical protein
MQNSSEFQYIAIDTIHESATNPRRTFDEYKLGELADFVPGNKIGVLFRRPFCCQGRGEPHGNRRLPYVIGT